MALAKRPQRILDLHSKKSIDLRETARAAKPAREPGGP
jgi:hypothetical protein